MWARSAVLAQLLDGDRVEIGEEGLAGLAHGRFDDLFDQLGMRADLVGIGGAEADRGAHDFADRDPAAFAREFVAAAWSAHALENLGVDKALQQRLEMSRRQFVPRGERLGRDRRRRASAGRYRRRPRWRAGCVATRGSFYFSSSERPVEPKPFGPRSLASSGRLQLGDALDRRDDELRNARAPSNEKGLCPKLIKMTPISPR